MHKIILLLSVIMASVSAWAQELTLQGRVVDANTGEALPYVSIYAGEGKGTLSNSDGDFKLTSDKEDTLVFSCVGYNKQTISASALPQIIRMKPYVNSLNEVSIHVLNKKRLIDNILKQTIKNLNKDYENRKKLAGRYFCRTLTEMDGKSHITEAFLIAHSAVNLRSVLITRGLQGSDTEGHGGTLNMLYSNIGDLFGVAPMTYESYFWNSSIKPLSDMSSLHSYYDMQIQQMHGEDGSTLYKIDFTLKKDLPIELKYRHNITGTAYVDSSNYRLLRFDGAANNHTLGVTWGESSNTTIKFQLEYDYKQDVASVSHLIIHGNNERSSYHVLLLAVDENKKEIDYIRRNNGNTVADINNVDFNAKPWDKYDIVKRTREEEKATFGQISTPKDYDAVDVDTVQTDNNALRMLWKRLWLYSKRYAQEKVFIHMDNTCYCLGDTIWFSAYTRDTDMKKPSLQSRVLYVELINNEGFLVERKHIDLFEGFGTGYFSLGSPGLCGGFYEIRAYTRWQLNWGEYERNHSDSIANFFIDKDKEHAFFRDYEKLYSRVFPVYDPTSENDATPKVMTLRSVTEEQRRNNRKRELNVQLYPEGGHLVDGIETHVAYEATWDDGEWAEGTLYVGDDAIPTSDRGRGRFVIIPVIGMHQSISFVAKDGTKSVVKFPEVENSGVSLHTEEKNDSWNIIVRLTDNIPPQNLGLSIMNEGKVCYFRQISKQTEEFIIPTSSLLPGVNQATVFDSHGHVMSDRLFFVWKNWMEKPTLKIGGLRNEYQPFEKVELLISCPMIDSTRLSYPQFVSMAVRDQDRMDNTYDNANILAEMLLASEIRGFVPNPTWYFQKNDAEHKDALDLLLMVQGWRRFSWSDMASKNTWKPVQPREKSITLLGNVYNLPRGENKREETDDFRNMLHTETMNPYFLYPTSTHIFRNLREDGSFSVTLPDPINDRNRGHLITMDVMNIESDYQIAGIKDRNIKDFRNKQSYLLPANRMTQKQPMDGSNNEMSKPIVRLDKPYPRFVHPYSYYQQHIPGKTIKQVQLSQKDFMDQSPSLMISAEEFLYNLDDVGFSISENFDSLKALATLSTGDFNNAITIRRGINRFRRKLDKIKSVSPDSIYLPKYLKSYPMSTVFSNNELREYEGEGSIENYVIYTDANLRDTNQSQSTPLTIVEYPYADGVKRVKPASRTFYMSGFAPYIQFYHPNYKYMPENVKDYRRTLYWSPSLLLNKEGKARVVFYNNSRTTHLNVEAEGQATDGTLLWSNTE
ncbi:MAG: carboxypeptidase-like regulatory domain-containing protein [Bacteroidaceae bacterium]|nr:carboxypeptidase-like regulatory domain-containing protein [Bacteroidaceae bacterium]